MSWRETTYWFVTGASQVISGPRNVVSSDSATGADYLAAPAIYAATIYVACRSRLPRARSGKRIVVRGSACEGTSWTSRKGTPASKLAR